MRTYSVEILPGVQKFIDRLDVKTRNRLLGSIGTLSAEPRPTGCKKLVNQGSYRIRVGDYRVLYNIKDKVLLVIVVKIGHRKNVYD